MAQSIRPVMLVILDGFGWREETADNAVRQARKPNFDRLWQTCPHAFLHTSGRDVGLPDGQMGNSEVGHLNIGAGRVVDAGPAAHRPGRRGRQPRPRAGAADADRAAEGLRRHLPSDGPRLARRRALAPGPRCRRWPGSLHEAGVQDRRPRLHRRPRHAAALGADDIDRLHGGAADGRARSPPSAAATTRWTATSAGTASPRPTTRMAEAEGARFADRRRRCGRRLRRTT